MSKVTVVDHHHDTDAGVYRLLFTREESRPVTILVANPDFDPLEEVSDDNLPAIEQEDTHTTSIMEEVVWDADDERWEGKDEATIAAEQRKIVSDMLTKRASETEQAEAQAAQARKDLGGVGEAL